MDAMTEGLPSAQPEWNNHTVACLLAELFDDTCACNYNDIDEWLPEKCDLLDSCPNPGGVACWEQFLKHKAKRRTDHVVRCEDCKWRHSTFVCPVSYENRLDKNYCCFGERKDDE